MAKLQRNYILTVEDNAKPSKVVTIQMPFTIEFDVTRNSHAGVCNASIKIYNLGETTRNRLYKDIYNTHIYNKIVLKAGYGKNIQDIFIGNVSRCFSAREGVNYITTIEAYSGDFASLTSRINKSIAAGIKKQVIIEDLIGSLPKISKMVMGANYEGSLSRGNALFGNTVDLIKELTGNRFFIDNETAYVLRENECTKGIVNLINSNSGLLGSPRREETFLTFDMIFEPRITMFQIINLEPVTEKIFNGQFKVIAIRHSGMISETVSGKVITNIRLWYGNQNLREVTA